MKNNCLCVITWLWVIDIAILLTIYTAWLLYPSEVDWLKLTLQVTITKDELLKNINSLMTYLTNPFATKLVMPDFPSSANGLEHFKEVKQLFHLAQAIFLIACYPSYYFLKQNSIKKSLFLFQRFFTLTAILPGIMALIGFFVGFDQFFTVFHKVLFFGRSTWLFNPATDPIIWVLPETFFLHCFLFFLMIYEIMMVGLGFLAKHQLTKRLQTALDIQKD